MEKKQGMEKDGKEAGAKGQDRHTRRKQMLMGDWQGTWNFDKRLGSVGF